MQEVEQLHDDMDFKSFLQDNVSELERIKKKIMDETERGLLKQWAEIGKLSESCPKSYCGVLSVMAFKFKLS